MNRIVRFLLLVLVFIIALHSILTLTHSGYRNFTKIQNIKSPWHIPDKQETIIPDEYYIPQCSPAEVPSKSDPTFVHDTSLDEEKLRLGLPIFPSTIHNTGEPRPPLMNATFVILARNSDVDGIAKSVRELEDRFNRRHAYPYVFLNEEPFSDYFKRRILILVNPDSKVEWGLIPKEHWYQPEWIDEEKATAARQKMEDEGVLYGGSVSYRNMCRYNSGFFFKHELLQKYRWYWRIEPDVHFHCDVVEDPFEFMEKNNKTYGWTITLLEFGSTIPNLWYTVKDFMKDKPQYVATDNAMGWLSDSNGETYNNCHFWSNFEIADMDFWRGDAYQAFFDHLDKTGGFYYERWGDAPVHSIAVGVLLPKQQIHWFNNIGYEHHPNTHCPSENDVWRKGRCTCNPNNRFDYNQWSCNKQWDRIW